jgi:PAS domain S-box-containing protein
MLGNVIDLAPIGLAAFALNGRFVGVNERMCEILGSTRDELLARTFQEVTFPDDLPRCLEMNAKLAANQIPSYSLEKRFVRKDKSSVWARITVSAQRRRDGTAQFFIGAAEDITEQVNALNALRSAEERLRAALDASMIGTFRFDVRRNVLEWADGFDRVFGRSDYSTLNQFFEVIHPDDRDYVMTAYRKSADEGADFEEEFRVVWEDGSVHWLHDHGRTVLGADGKPHYILGAITDITNHKRMEDVIAQHDQERQRMQSFLDALRHSLQAVNQASNSLREGASPDGRARETGLLIDHCLREIDRLLTSFEAGK